MPTTRDKLNDYDPDCAAAAADLWLLVADHEGEDADAQLIIARALKEYACEADKRITSDEWAQKYKAACIDVSKLFEVIEELRANADVTQAWLQRISATMPNNQRVELGIYERFDAVRLALAASKEPLARR